MTPIQSERQSQTELANRIVNAIAGKLTLQVGEWEPSICFSSGQSSGISVLYPSPPQCFSNAVG